MLSKDTNWSSHKSKMSKANVTKEQESFFLNTVSNYGNKLCIIVIIIIITVVLFWDSA